LAVAEYSRNHETPNSRAFSIERFSAFAEPQWRLKLILNVGKQGIIRENRFRFLACRDTIDTGPVLTQRSNRSATQAVEMEANYGGGRRLPLFPRRRKSAIMAPAPVLFFRRKSRKGNLPSAGAALRWPFGEAAKCRAAVPVPPLGFNRQP
jgi:hypothetical protein